MPIATASPEEGTSHLEFGTSLYRHDLERGVTETHDFGFDRVPGEFVFVPAAAEGAETDGWYMGLVIDAAAETTDLVLLSAADFTGPPQASHSGASPPSASYRARTQVSS